jgi:hypothetical protein
LRHCPPARKATPPIYVARAGSFSSQPLAAGDRAAGVAGGRRVVCGASPDQVGRTDSPEDVALAHRRERTTYYKMEEWSRKSAKPI